MLKQFSAIAVAALVAGVATFLPGWSPSVSASTPSPVAKADRADITDCSMQGWPYYQTPCIHDHNRNAGRAMPVRLITTDRLDITLPNHTAQPEWTTTLASLQTALPVWVRTAK